MSGNGDKRPVRDDFGQRYLTDSNDVYSHNAWDNVDFGPEKLEEIDAIIEDQRSSAVENSEEIVRDTGQSWDLFYGKHSSGFFKDRQWLIREFPEVFRASDGKVPLP